MWSLRVADKRFVQCVTAALELLSDEILLMPRVCQYVMDAAPHGGTVDTAFILSCDVCGVGSPTRARQTCHL